jgi:hypothetical protein
MEHQMNIELGTIIVPLGRNGKYGHFDVEADRFNNTVHEHIYKYGLRQIINDAMADKTDDDGNALATDVIVAKAQKRLDTLYSGDIRTRMAGSAEPLDPIEAEAWRIVKADLVVMAKPFAEKVKGLKGDAALLARINVSRVNRRMAEFASLEDAITAYLGGPRGQAILKRAQRNVAERAKAVDMAESGI